ncbi:MAG: HAD family hydrolase [Acidimicrobiia bacterium]
MTAVVFDCDGVLVDSEPLSEAAWTEVLAGYGYTPTPADFAACLGRATKDTVAHFASRVTLPAASVIATAVDGRRIRRYATDLRVFPDAAAAVALLAELGVTMAVASSSSRRNLDRKLEIAGMTGDFAATVSGDDVTAGKPAPDLYLAAAARVGLDPATCIAVEDAVLGVEAAEAAGMRAVLIDRGNLPPGVDRPVWDRIDGARLAALAGR